MPSNLEIPELRKQIESINSEIRLQAVKRLAQFAGTNVAGVAANILLDSYWTSSDEIREEIYNSLYLLGEAAIRNLIRRLSCNNYDGDYRDYVLSGDILVRIGKPAIAAIQEMARNGDSCTRSNAEKLLQRICHKYNIKLDGEIAAP